MPILPGQRFHNFQMKDFKMKKWIWMIGCLWVVSSVFAQHAHEEGGCDCPSCLAKGATTFSLSGLEGLNKPTPEVCEQDEHAGHDHGQADVPVFSEHEVEDQDEHAGHEHAVEAVAYDDHTACVGDDAPAGEGALSISSKIAEKIGLKVSVATGGEISRSTTFPAEIVLNRDQAAAVSPRFPSVIRQVFAEIGDEVKKGDILASLENRESLAVYTVSAPLDGVVVRKDAAVGESAGEDRILFEVADLGSVWADISVFPKFQHSIRKGMKVEFFAHDGHAAHGTIHYVSPIASHETRTFTARCVLSGAGEDFTPGVFVRAQITTESADVSVRIERNAVQTVQGATVVFISDEHGFESRDVVVGMADEQFVEIKQGLAAGESYVSAGSFALKAQMVTSGMDPHAGCGH